MKTFFIKSFFLVLLVVLTCAGLFLAPLPYNHELASIIDKRDMLKQGTGGRIIFVGGSGLYDGLDSAAVRAAFNRPVVNMGLYGGFGISSLLREMQPFIGKDDVVVLIPEYGTTIGSYRDETRKWLFALAPSGSYARLYGSPPKGLLLFLEDFFSLLRTKALALPKLPGMLFSRKEAAGPRIPAGYVGYAERFDSFGDSRVPFRKVPADRIEGRGITSGEDYLRQDLAEVNEFIRETGEKGAVTFFVFPAFPREEFLLHERAIRRYEKDLKTELSAPILGRPEDFLYSIEWFTNTVNHLTAEGKEARTRKLVSLLEPHVR